MSPRRASSIKLSSADVPKAAPPTSVLTPAPVTASQPVPVEVGQRHKRPGEQVLVRMSSELRDALVAIAENTDEELNRVCVQALLRYAHESGHNVSRGLPPRRRRPRPTLATGDQ